MSYQQEHSLSKAKVSVTIDESVLERVDQAADGMSRSEIVERALKRWLSDRRRRLLEEEIVAYYAEQTEEERSEDREWAELSASELGKTWK